MLIDEATPDKPTRKHRATQEERLQTVEYIIEEWEKETPGITANVDPAQLQEDILRLMRRSNISTIDDYEVSKVKLSRDHDDDYDNI